MDGDYQPNNRAVRHALATERSRGNLDEQRDKFYCGAGKDHYYADKNDYVSSSCEKKIVGGGAA